VLTFTRKGIMRITQNTDEDTNVIFQSLETVANYLIDVFNAIFCCGIEHYGIPPESLIVENPPANLEGEITQLKTELTEAKNLNNRSAQTISDLEEQIEEKNRELQSRQSVNDDQEIEELKNELDGKNQIIEKLTKDILQYIEEILEKEKKFTELATIHKALEEEYNSLILANQNVEQDIEEIKELNNSIIDEFRKTQEQLSLETQKHEKELDMKDQGYNFLKKQLTNTLEEQTPLRNQVKQLNLEKKVLNNQVDFLSTENERLENKNKELQNQLDEYETESDDEPDDYVTDSEYDTSYDESDQDPSFDDNDKEIPDSVKEKKGIVVNFKSLQTPKEK